MLDIFLTVLLAAVILIFTYLLGSIDRNNKFSYHPKDVEEIITIKKTPNRPANVKTEYKVKGYSHLDFTSSWSCQTLIFSSLHNMKSAIKTDKVGVTYRAIRVYDTSGEFIYQELDTVIHTLDDTEIEVGIR